MKYKFPPTFKFGVADADLQVIGEKFTRQEEHSEETEWNYFARTSGKCFENTTPDDGVDRYHHWADDIKLMQEMGLKHYRTSVSMSRILKKNGEVNSQAVRWYHNYYKALKTAGINVYATLYHWEIPHYACEQGGWLNRDLMVNLMSKHAAAVYENLGEFINEYFILNEPWCSSLLSYHLGEHAPGHKSLKEGLLASQNLLLSQAAAFRTIKGKNPSARVGTVLNVQPAYAMSLEPNDIRAAAYADGYFNTWFLEPMYLGKYPEHMLELFGENAPKASKADLEAMKIGPEMYALGINYYRGDIVAYDENKDIKQQSITFENGPKNDLDWPIFVPPYYPEGLTDILQQIYYRFRDQGLKRLYITENGMAQNTEWDGKSKVIDDSRRLEYVKAHLQQAYQAIARGVPLEGYFLWTLMDNYEWAHGYRPNSCFGIVHVSRKNMQRVKKKTAVWYEQVVKSGFLPEA